MAITREQKSEIIESYRRASADTGSPEVQIAILTARILDLTGHIKTHKKGPRQPARPLDDGQQRNSLLKYLDPHRAASTRKC